MSFETFGIQISPGDKEIDYSPFQGKFEFSPYGSDGKFNERINYVEKLCSVFNNLGFKEHSIALVGGDDEVSHTGDLHYGNTYNDVESFVENALSDFRNGVKDAEEKYQGWATCLNFSFFVLELSNTTIDITVYYHHNNIIHIIFDDTIENRDYITKNLDVIKNNIEKNLYEDTCYVVTSETYFAEQERRAKALEELKKRPPEKKKKKPNFGAIFIIGFSALWVLILSICFIHNIGKDAETKKKEKAYSEFIEQHNQEVKDAIIDIGEDIIKENNESDR